VDLGDVGAGEDMENMGRGIVTFGEDNSGEDLFSSCNLVGLKRWVRGWDAELGGDDLLSFRRDEGEQITHHDGGGWGGRGTLTGEDGLGLLSS
jgi:hypothetical protein